MRSAKQFSTVSGYSSGSYGLPVIISQASMKSLSRGYGEGFGYSYGCAYRDGGGYSTDYGADVDYAKDAYAGTVIGCAGGYEVRWLATFGVARIGCTTQTLSEWWRSWRGAVESRDLSVTEAEVMQLFRRALTWRYQSKADQELIERAWQSRVENEGCVVAW